ncbi:hypothetical protein CBR_g36472 [Chara braunii]|uniref:Uncharacterized protein n=1 Tax=Chara braunii TaxID=69332 RepID=A0A388LL48_CHABU|nr:hypothetical protein CBR_g36472 [Chara braunii]|eukprot:GBG82945.1 hypothetical protein CBR_g36472 [Chara braunii]
MVGHGNGRDYDGSNHNRGRDYGGHRVYGRGHRGYESDQSDGGDRSYDGDQRLGGERNFDRGTRRQALDPLESKVVEIGKRVAAVCQYVEAEQQKKVVKERRKAERKEAEERAEAERAAVVLNKQRKEEQARKEADAKEELHKSLAIRMVVRVGELREEVREDVRQKIREAINELCMIVTHWKHKKKDPVEFTAGSRASSSKTEELNLQTRRLCVSEKRKRGPEVPIEGSPPMELPSKRTPVRAVQGAGGTRRLTRARTCKQKVATPKKTPPSIRKKTPATIGVVGRLRFEKRVLNDLKNLDAVVLQNICKDESIPYNRKFGVIFDIATYRTHVAYGTDNDEELIAPPVVSADAVAEEDREEKEG